MCVKFISGREALASASGWAHASKNRQSSQDAKNRARRRTESAFCTEAARYFYVLTIPRRGDL